MSTDKFTKIHIDLPNHWATGGESLWAVDLGNDLYEVRSVPFHAYGVNLGDVVQATAIAPNLKPEVRSVVRRSGNQTLRLFFAKGVDGDAQQAFLEGLRTHHVSYERGTKRLVALDLEPEADIDAVRDVLDSRSKDALGDYETCEERVAGGFDAAPDDGNDVE